MERVSREAQMSIAASSMFPGFRFCPTDEELISYYLRKKLEGHEESVQVIAEVELCKFEPWDLPGKSFIQSDNEWFFFSPRGRKYPNGSQSKRATESGYWKATGKERNVKAGPNNVIGTKRTLVFHLGRAPKGERTEWIMHEYCINDKSQDAMVVCRLKRNTDFRVNDTLNRASSSQMHHHHVNSHESDCDQREVVSRQEKDPGGCSSKRSCSSNSSPSTEQMDSVTESNQRPPHEATLTESSGHPKVEEEDCYAEILKDDIIKLDESSLSQKAHTTTPAPPPQQDHPCQGTAQRRIRLRVGNSRPPPPTTTATIAEGRVRFPISKNSSKNTTNSLCDRFRKRSVALFGLLIFTLVCCLLGGLKLVRHCGWGVLGGVS